MTRTNTPTINAMGTRLNELEAKNLHAACVEMARATEQQQSYVVPIFASYGDQSKLDRSGIILGIAEARFLVTAAHDLVRYVDHRVHLQLAPLAGERIPVSVRGRLISDDEDVVDVAAIKLDATVIDRLPRDQAVVRLSDMDWSSTPTDGLYMVRGYPTQYFHRDQVQRFHVRQVSQFAKLFLGEPPETEYPYDASVHLLLEHYKRGWDVGRKPNRTPRIKGMSGGGIWRLAISHGAGSTERKIEDSKLVAIQTKALHGMFFKGTWVRFVLRIIEQNFPELRRVIRMHGV